MRSGERDALPTPKVDTPRLVKLKAGGLLAGLVIVVLIVTAAWLYFLARLARDLAIWIFRLRTTHLLPRILFCKLDIRPSSPVAPSQLSGAGSGLGRSSDTSLRYKEAKLHSRVFVDEQHGGVIGCVTFFYDVGWNGFPLAIFQVLPLV